MILVKPEGDLIVLQAVYTRLTEPKKIKIMSPAITPAVTNTMATIAPRIMYSFFVFISVRVDLKIIAFLNAK